MRRWSATTSRPTPHLPVHPWLYGLLPDDEGTPLVAIAFRLELDVQAHCDERDEETDESNQMWEKVRNVLTKFPPLRSEFHLVPIQHVREWLEQQKDSQIALAHYDGEIWDNEVDPKCLSSNSVIVLPTSCTSEQVKTMQERGIIPKGTKGNETQPLWDVFEKMAADGARYMRHVETTKTSIRASDRDPVYRVDLDADGKSNKDHDKWQRAMGNTRAWRQAEGLDESVRIAKPVTEKPANAGGYRHEWGSLMKVNEKPLSFLNHLPEAERRFYHDLYLHLIAAHHGYFRPSLPDRGLDSPPTPAKQSPLRLECIERAARLQRQLGYWRLAYLESLLKVADVAGSRDTEHVPFEGADNLDEA